jgi:hypothetical protein
LNLSCVTTAATTSRAALEAGPQDPLTTDQNQLYFAAYQGSIHVYRPRKAPHIVSSAPDVVLEPRRTWAARVVGGYIDSCTPHQVNHLVVGNLGDLEILLMSFDDGDVAAYYTHHVAQYVVRLDRARREKSRADAAADVAAGSSSSGKDQRQQPPAFPGSRGSSGYLRKPRCFFRENVGKSAWGLAVHQQSRLIAVSSNNVEVTVFAFALTTPTYSAPSGDGDKAPSWPISGGNESAPWVDERARVMEEHMRTRNRSWRIVLPLPHDGTNMPSISFMNGRDGNAEKVVATDIDGHVWILDIWKFGVRPVKVPVALGPVPRYVTPLRQRE